ncbi:amino acid ABC transporter substrate-binding protein [Pseudomonas knackmussii]|uniref:amino acid ABC transporter substrate-binding protein n=1 Tax=Pseudomonas knackmussii TaxID=65741 RepID=UPI003F4A34A5
MKRTIPTLLALGLSALLTLPATAGSLERIRANHELVLGFIAGDAPFTDGDEKQASGYGIDLCQAVATELRKDPALAQLQTRYRPVQLAQALDAVSSGQVDLLCSPLVETLQRRETVSFSLPVITAGIGAILRSDAPADLRDALSGAPRERGPTWRATVNQGLSKRTFAVLKGTLGATWVRQRARELGLQSNLVEVGSYDEGVQQVLNRRVDAFFGDRLSLLHYQSRNGNGEQLQVAARLFEAAHASLVLARGDDDFRLLVDRALSQSLRGDAGEALYTRYFGSPTEQQLMLLRLYSLP